MAGRTFAEIGRIEAARQLFEGSGYEFSFEALSLPEAKAGESIVSASRMLLEGTDFNLMYFPLKHLGYKAVVEVTGELYASMARPSSLGITLGVSSKLDLPEVKEFWDGVLAASREHGYSRLSLDLIPSVNGLAASLHAVGVCRTAGRRPKARSKDLLCVSGSLGSAYLGQQVIERRPSEMEKYKMMVADYLRPELSHSVVSALEETGIVPAAGAFVSRGLSDAVMKLSAMCGTGSKVYADRIPFEGNSFSLGKELDIDPVSAAMNGGDDCRLLFVISISDYERFRTDFQVFDIIGHLALPEVGNVLVTPDGMEHDLSAPGW